RGLLPGLHLDPDAESSAVAGRLLPEAEQEIARPPSLKKLLERHTIASELRFDRIDDEAASQVNGGVVRGGVVSPYAALRLRGDGRRRLVVAGHGLGRAEIDGVHVTAYVDEATVGTFAIGAAERFERPFEVPAEVAARPFVSVRFQSDD